MSLLSPSAKSGGDFDLRIPRGTGTSIWNSPVLLYPSMATDSNNDEDPSAFAVGGRLIVGWSFNHPSNPSFDEDQAVVAQLTSTSPPWSDPIALANTSGEVDSSPEGAMVVGIEPDDTVHRAWQSQDDLGGSVGTDEDILTTWFTTTVWILVDGFESGDTSAWSHVAGG